VGAAPKSAASNVLVKLFFLIVLCFALAGLAINIIAITVGDGSFALTRANWSIAISVGLMGFVVAAVSLLLAFIDGRQR
jgi:hypothetical protein